MVPGLKRLASVDIGTNSVLLLVAERDPDGTLRAVREAAEITRLGRGVDRTGVLSPEGMEATLTVLARFAAEAREAGAAQLVVTATSAARDARNGAEFLQGARQRAGTEVEILSGEEEARLGYLAVAAEFADRAGTGGLLAIDVGGGSTEFVHGTRSTVLYRASLDIGSVRLTERCVRSDPPSAAGAVGARRGRGGVDTPLPPPSR
jgi:exopolyphosphatase/guanosine-5'-triphosphate,3'-diphosphate pyrophosphatase